MSPRLRNPLLATTLLALGMTAGWFVRGWGFAGNGAPVGGAVPSPEPSRPPSLARPDDAKGSAQKSASPGLALLHTMFAERSENDPPPDQEKFEADQFTAYLERHKRDAASLLAVWELTHDAGLLREAYEKEPTNLMVGVNAFQSLPLSDDEKRRLARSLQEAHPDSVVGSVLAASLAAKHDDKTEFRDLLGEAQQHLGLDLDIGRRSLAMREALMSLGKSSLEARILAYTRREPPPQEFSAVARAGSREIKRLIAGGEMDEALKLSGQMMALGQPLQQEPGRTVAAQLMAQFLEQSALGGLPEEVEIGDTGRTPKQQIAFLKSESSWIVPDIKAGPWHLQHFDEAGAELYFQIREQRGDREALKWAETYNGRAPKPTAK